MRQHVHKYLAEGLGAFTLTLAASLSIVSDKPLATPVIAALTLGLFVYTVGGISGAHLNPAVTLALLSVRKITVPDAVAYIVVQLLGGALAAYATIAFAGQGVEIAVTPSWSVAIAEAIGAFILVWGVSAVANNKVSGAATGLTVGGSLLLGILIASTASAGVLNPAVALGLKFMTAAYLIGPVIGGLVAAQLYKYVNR